MTYVIEKGLVDLIVSQRKEAEEFTASAPGNFMGMMPCHTDTKYWEQRVPSGTLAEYERIELEESVYYAVADAYGKSMARSMNLSVWTTEELETELEHAYKKLAS